MKLLRLLPRFRRAYRSLRELELREHWARPEIEAFQLHRLNALWQHAVAHVPYYRRLREQLDLPGRFAGLAEYQAAVPVLAKGVVRADPLDWVSDQPPRGRWMRTGGSTGTPMNVFWATEAHRAVLRSKYRFLAAWGRDIFDRTAYLWGHSAAFKPGLAGPVARLRQPLEDRLRNRIRLSAYTLGRADLRAYLKRIAAFGPAVLYGYSRAFQLLALEAEAAGLGFPSVKLVIMTGEPAFPNIVDTVERVFQAPAVVEYGSVECGFLAGEQPDRTLRVREDGVILETLPRPDGRQDLVVTVLSNPAFPLLRYAIGDVTDAPLERPATGFAILKNVAGRNNDLVLTRSGRYLHSARFDALFKYGGSAIRRFRVRQHADGALSVALELSDPAALLDTAGLQQKLTDLVEGYPVKLDVVDTIPQSASGKHRLILSDLDLANLPPAGPALRNGHNGKHEGANGQSPVVLTPVVRPATPQDVPKTTRLLELIRRPELTFLMEAHNGLSARIVEEAGFEGIWASGLSIAAALGVRDANEASWTQVLEVLEFMSDVARIPILVDGDTGHGNFNNMRRLVQKLEQRGIAGVCIEDKVFPKTNSLLPGVPQPLADIDEFCGRIKAGKDAQKAGDFVLVARVEAFIAGWGLKEAIKRAEAYHQAGADAILIHSAQRSPREVLAFKEEWGDRLPVVLVPTKYYATPTELFRKYRFATVIWANHLMRSCITAMQRTAQEIFEAQSLVCVEDRVAPLAEVFRLQGADELAEAEKRYLPRHAGHTRAVILAAARGQELGEMTASRPKCMVSIAGTPLLGHIAGTYRAAGVTDLVVVRGYKKDTVDLEGLKYFDNDEPATGEAYSLAQALPALEGHCLISFGDVLFKKYIPQELMDLEVDFAVAVDTDWRASHRRGRKARYVTCSSDSPRRTPGGPVTLRDVAADLDPAVIHGEWMGFLKVSGEGARFLRELLHRVGAEGDQLRGMDMAQLLREILQVGKEIRVVYTTGHWLDIDTVEDVLAGGAFQ